MRKVYKKMVMTALLTASVAMTASAAWQGTDQVFTVPYSENFNNSEAVIRPNNECYYPGWTIITPNKNSMFQCRVNSTLDPQGDGNYMVARAYSGARNDWAISPAITLRAGTKYTVSLKFFAPGGASNKPESFKLTVGTDTTEAAQSTVILDLPNVNYKAWTTVTAEYTPTADGNYYFGVNSYTPSRAYFIAFDDFKVEGADALEAQAKFYVPTALWSATSTAEGGLRLLAEGQPLTFINQSANATAYSWVTGGNPGESTEESPVVTYPASGSYSPALTASNASGSNTFSLPLNIKFVTDGEYTDDVTNRAYDDAENGSPLYQQYHYVAGMSRYYTKIAERYELPEGTTATVNDIKVSVNDAAVTMRQLGYDVPMTLAILGDADGLPDDNNVIATYATTVYTLMGGTSATNKVAQYVIDQPVKVTGNFHIVLSIDGFSPSLLDHFGLNTITHQEGESTFSAYFIAGRIENVEGWNKLENVAGGTAYKGLGALIYPNVTFNSSSTGLESLTPAGEVTSVRYYDLTGRSAATPFHGVNIVVSNHADGTVTTAKIMK
ncbi:MAG: carbohydrate binding domain-containing protein [Muribaculaceae bacterium]|nr:carbohydrate binding domain-containing protein [Muribaculaceae bacterium]